MKAGLTFFLIFCLFSCHRQKEYAISSNSNYDFIEFDTIEYSKSIVENIYSYDLPENSLVYSLTFKSTKESRLEWNGEDKIIYLKDSSEIVLNGEELTVFRFIVDPFKIDGSTLHYFDRKYGLLIYHSNTWDNHIAFKPWAVSLPRLNIWSANQGLESDSILLDIEKELGNDLNER